MMDYMNMDDRSVGMFWVVSYTMAQPACETVMNWLSSAGVTELFPGSNLPPNERLMVMREVNPLPMSLLTGFSLNLCLKLALQMEDSIFGGQVLLMFFCLCCNIHKKRHVCIVKEDPNSINLIFLNMIVSTQLFVLILYAHFFSSIKMIYMYQA